MTIPCFHHHIYIYYIKAFRIDELIRVVKIDLNRREDEEFERKEREEVEKIASD